MGRQLLRGGLGALAALATLYALGAVGLFVEWLTGRPSFNGAIACGGLLLALGVGVAVLRRLGRSADQAAQRTRGKRGQVPSLPAEPARDSHCPDPGTLDDSHS